MVGMATIIIGGTRYQISLYMAPNKWDSLVHVNAMELEEGVVEASYQI